MAGAFTLGAMAGLLLVGAEPGALSAWQMTEQKSTLDGAVGRSAHLSASNQVANIIGRMETPVLTFSCDKHGLYAIIQWPDFIGQFNDDDRATVRWKLDDGKVQSSTWFHSDMGAGPMGRGAQDWIRQLAKAKRLTIQVPDRHGGQEATFDLAEIAEIAPKFTEVNCG